MIQRLLRITLALATALLAACPGPAPSEEPVFAPRILSIEAPSPVLLGSLLRVRGVDLDRLGPEPVLAALEGGSALFTLALAPGSGPSERLFRLSRAALDALSVGSNTLDVVLEGRGLTTDRFTLGLVVASDLPLELDEGLSGAVHRNDVIVLDGEGFIGASEGEIVLAIDGTFTRPGLAGAPVHARLPVALAELSDRTRGVVTLTTELGGPHPGELIGTATLERTLLGAEPSRTAAREVALSFGAPELFSFDGGDASVGRLVTVRGAGFLGGSERPSEATTIRLRGRFTPRDGEARDLDAELVPRFVSGAEVRVVIEPEVRDERVVARLFGAQRGVFEGSATPVAIAGRDEVVGATVPIRLALGAPVQVVSLRFLPGYYESLARFGLGAAEDEIALRIVRRMEEIYEGVNVDVRLEEPSDFDASVTTVIEIGGPDPNGNGLFGYDNSPGKDVSNLRMFDAIGGANAETQADGFPGFGGIFVESLLYFSSHPELPGAVPPSSPDGDPLFDAIFDPVRARPARRAELQGEGEPARLDAIERAIGAFASIVGETTAHELGHSLGLARPYGPITAFHREDDGDGCVMDAGRDRPLAERAAEPGAARSRFCDDEPAYLRSILAD